ncbi:hypothetical protein TNCV_79921 [Trichonephila clavipes]|nr:hypothetical protein TNCV_79921 [Trichonephila clavipes]
MKLIKNDSEKDKSFSINTIENMLHSRRNFDILLYSIVCRYTGRAVKLSVAGHMWPPVGCTFDTPVVVDSETTWNHIGSQMPFLLAMTQRCREKEQKQQHIHRTEDILLKVCTTTGVRK